MFWFKVGLFTPYVYRFLDGPGLPPVLPSYYVKVVVFYGVSCCLRVTVYGWRLFKVFLFFFPLVSLMFLLYIPHHNPDDGTGSYRLIHFCCPWGPGPWASWGFVWWLYFPWSVPVYHTYHMFVLCFQLYLLCDGMTICPTMALLLGLLMVGLLPSLLLLVIPLLFSLVLLLLLVGLLLLKLVLNRF